MVKKVLVLGCSIGGLSCAKELLELTSNIQVTLIDIKRKIGDVTCAQGLSRFVLDDLKLELPQDIIANVVRKATIHAPNGTDWTLETESREYAYVLYRDRWEQKIAREIKNLGGKFILGKSLTKIPLGYDAVVGADGISGITNKTLRLPPLPPTDLYLGVQVNAKLSTNGIELYVGKKVAPKGFAWVFPTSENTARVGLGVPLNYGGKVRTYLNNVLEIARAEPISKMKAKLIPLSKPLRKLVYSNVLLVGDAGHLCDPATGGGIHNAIKSGRYAARTIVEGNLERYDSCCEGIKRENRFRYQLKKLICQLSDEDYNRLIKSLQGFEPRFTGFRTALFHTLLRLSIKEPKLMGEVILKSLK